MTTEVSQELVQDVPVPLPSTMDDPPTEVCDCRPSFDEYTNESPRDERAELAFIAARAHMIRTHPQFDRSQRDDALATLEERVGREMMAAADKAKPKLAPVPGGVGRGMFYTPAYKSSFGQGTSLYFEIVCPNKPGGNVTDYLYLTAMNRAGRGIEAFVSYHAQDEAHFKVFDWARPDHWQTDVLFGSLAKYLWTATAHGVNYQVMGVWNTTTKISDTTWRNEAVLLNRVANTWDLFYRFDYTATQAEQTGGTTGMWGPIVETFQPSYSNTNPFGALNTQLQTRGSNGVWNGWQALSAANSTVRNDNLGFFNVFLDPNYAFVVDS